MKLKSGVRQVFDTDPAEARRLAEKILSDRKYKEARPPNPFERPIAWIGATVRRFFSSIADLVDRIIPGNARQAWGVIALLAGLATVLFVIQLAIRRQRVRAIAAIGKASLTFEDPAQLEALAAAAANKANYGESIRLRFRAGLVRLEQSRRIADPSHHTNGDIYESVRAEPLLHLQRQFDQIIYGRAEANADDEAEARRNWKHLLNANDPSERQPPVRSVKESS